MPDPDASVIAIFRTMAIKNEGKSADAGRPIFDDVEVCELRYPGSKNVGVYPALAFCRWVIDPESGEQMKQSYAERFAQQYRQFKAHAQQTKSGTPLTHAPFLTEARRAEMRALNVYTVEQLAAVDGAELKNLGPGGREMKNQAIAYLEEATSNAGNTKLAARLEALEARNALLEEDLARARENGSAADGECEGMTLEQLRDYIEDATGHPVQGNANRKTLLRMADEVKASKVG